MENQSESMPEWIKLSEWHNYFSQPSWHLVYKLCKKKNINGLSDAFIIEKRKTMVNVKKIFKYFKFLREHEIMNKNGRVDHERLNLLIAQSMNPDPKKEEKKPEECKSDISVKGVFLASVIGDVILKTKVSMDGLPVVEVYAIPDKTYAQSHLRVQQR